MSSTSTPAADRAVKIAGGDAGAVLAGEGDQQRRGGLGGLAGIGGGVCGHLGAETSAEPAAVVGGLVVAWLHDTPHITPSTTSSSVTPDLAAARAFYAASLRLGASTTTGPTYAGIRSPGGDGEVGGLNTHGTPGPGGALVLILYSDDLDATVAAVEARRRHASSRRRPRPSRAGGASPSPTRPATSSRVWTSPPERRRADQAGRPDLGGAGRHQRPAGRGVQRPQGVLAAHRSRAR